MTTATAETSRADSAPTILLVDDDPTLLELMREYLADREGHEVVTATSPREAEPLIRSRNVVVIVSDHQMPGQTGIEFLERMKAHFPQIQRVLLTGYSERQVVLDAINRGAVCSFIEKKTELSVLGESVAFAMREALRFVHAEDAERSARRLEHQIRSDAYITRRVKELAGATTYCALVTLTAIAVAFGVGLVAFVALYVLKSFVGLDLFSGWHLA